MLTDVAFAVLRPRYRAVEAMDSALGDILVETHALLRRAFREEGLDPGLLGRDLESFRRGARASTRQGAPLRHGGDGTGPWARTATGFRVPWTHAHSRSSSEFQKDVAAALVVGRGLNELADGPSLIAQSGWEVQVGPEGTLEGFSAALAAHEAAWWVRRRMRPSIEGLRAPTVEARLAASREALVRGRLRSISGIPSYALALVALLGAHPEAAAALREVTAYVWSGMALGPGQAELAAALSPRLRLADVALATEGPLGIPGEEAGVYRLAARQALHLFVPDDGTGPIGEPRLATELEVGATYRVWLTSSAGLVHWDAGDRVRVRSTRPLRISYAPPALDPVRIGEALGTAWFRVYEGEPAQLVVEGDVDLAAGLALLPPGTTVRRVPPGSLARATIRLGLRGVPKLPWVYSTAALHRALVEALG